MVLYLFMLIMFSLHRESLKLILVDNPPPPEVVLSHTCLVCSADGISSWARARDRRRVPPPLEMIVLMMNHMRHHNWKRLLPMLVGLKIWIWKMLMWNLVRKHTLALSRNGQGILIKRLAQYVPMTIKKTPQLRNFGQRYNMMHFMVT
jgi:hypothetical protein